MEQTYENNDYIENEERFAVFFGRNHSSKNSEEYSFDSVALLDYDIETDEYIVESGRFEGLIQSSFGKIVGPENFIEGDDCEVSVVGDKNYKIYIFGNDFIDEISSKNNWDVFETYVYLARKLCEIKLVNDGEKFVAKKTPILHYLPLDEIEKQLYVIDDEIDEIPDKEVITIDLSSLVSQVLFNGIAFGGVQQMPMVLESQNEEYFDLEEEADAQPLMESDIDIASIIKEISDKIVGQEEVIKTLVSNIYYNQVLLDTLSKDGEIDETELDSRKVSILLDGSTGTGKTAITKDIASKLELPIEIVNANSFSETGYVGPTITDILFKLLDQANGDIELAERGIIVLDEIDKLATNVQYGGKDMKQGVQEELLAFIGGGQYEISPDEFFGPKIKFDTSKLTFIMCGAFTELRESKIREASKNSVGFNTLDNTKTRTYTITPQDYIDYGLLREFFGRIKVLTSTKTYTIEDLKEILLKSMISPLKNFEKTVKMFGYESIAYDDEFVENLANKAYQMGTGARGLQTIMSGIQNRMLIDLVEKNLEGNIKLTSDILEEYEKGNQRRY